MLQGKHITFSYPDPAKGKTDVLADVSFEIREHDFIGLIGASGSGKTTLIKHLNGLLKAESGEILFKGKNIYSKKYPLSELRKKVGLVFQYPEQQLFGRTILKDVMYGPLNLGMSEEEAGKSAKESLELVGIPEEYYQMSPMELSGGQKRCAAIAGVLAMQPEILVLDEPAAGLDPETKHEIFELLCRIREKRNNAIVLVSHHMEDVAQFANRVWVMYKGKIAMDGTPEEVYSRVEELEEMNIGIPQITHLTYSLIKEGVPLPRPAISVEEAEKMLGMPYTLVGCVEHGNHIGHTLGFPTVNLLPPAGKLLPPNGVYYAAVRYNGKIYKAISNVGTKPTVSSEKRMGVESYLYDFDLDIYGQEIEVALKSFRRPERRFGSLEELKKQLDLDIADGRNA